jgi:2'-5' RNA ligase
VGESWKSWMLDFKFGTFAFLPEGDLRATVDLLRGEYDPVSCETSMAHITLTQPFTKAPTEKEIEQLEKLIGSFAKFQSQVGPATTSPNKRLIWLDVNPKDPVLALREALHETGLFRTDLPLTKGFIPHMTISEAGREPNEVVAINVGLNAKYKPWTVPFASVAWIIPNEDFVFQEYRLFALK